MKERDYQRKLIDKLKRLFPGCVIIKNDSAYIQGIPDYTLFWGEYWAMLEIKISKNADVQPNQPYYVEKMNEMSFAAFIYPENEQVVLDELQRAFGAGRSSRVS